MKRTLISTILSLLVVLVCTLGLSSCFEKESCLHEYETPFDVTCKLCGEGQREVAEIESAQISADGKTITFIFKNGASYVISSNVTAEECLHPDYDKSVFVVTEHYRDENGDFVNGHYIDRCKTCGSYKEEYAVRHTVEDEHTEAATCQKAKTTYYKTACCGEFEVSTGELASCSFSEKWLKESGQGICAVGNVYIKVNTCDVCGAQKEGEAPEVISPTENPLAGIHTVEKWDTITPPTEDAEGLATGSCIYCDTLCEYTLPRVIYGGGDYEISFKDGSEGSCTKLPATCKLIVDGVVYDDFTYTNVEVTAKKHTAVIDGETVEIDLAGGVYDADARNGDASVFTPANAAELICKDGAVDGSFTCAACQGEYVTKVRKLHNYEYALSYTEEGGVFTYTLTGVCKNDGCGCETTVSHDSIADKISVTTETPATCTATGTAIHSILLDKSLETEQTELHFEVVLEMLEHCFHGFSFSEGECFNKNEIEGLAPIFTQNGGFDSFKCNETNLLKLPCDDCGAIYSIAVEVDHIVGETIKADTATCTEGGETTYKCAVCGEEQSESTPAKGHSDTKYKEIALIDKEGSVYRVSFNCSICGDVTEDAVLTYSEEKSTRSSCVEHGYDVYLKADGSEISVELPLSDIHVFEGQTMDKAVYVFSDFKSLTVQGSVTSCTEKVKASYACDLCGKESSIDVRAAHTYDESAENNVFLENSSRLVRECVAEGCTSIHMIDGVTKSVIEPKCLENGSVIYSYEGGSVEIVIPARGYHTAPVEASANGAYLANADGITIVYKDAIYCTSGIIENGGYYQCCDCGALEFCNVYLPHEPEADAEIFTILEPTCTEGGKGVYRCAACPAEFTGEEAIVVEIPALGHTYSYSVDIAPDQTKEGRAIGTCEKCQAASPVVPLPVVNAESYNADNTVIETVLQNSCTETGIEKYSYTFSVEGLEYTVDFEVVTPVYEYEEGKSVTYSYFVSEEVSFTDPYGESEITVVLDVKYTSYKCDNEACEMNTIISKSFEYDGNTYCYDFESGAYLIAVA